jgi:PAS domain S-box-containing protein
VKKYPLLKIALLYFLLGSLWLLAGAVVINWIDNQYPSVNLQGLHFFKNLIFLVATSVLVLFSLNYYYGKRFIAERKHKTELLANERKLNDQLNLYETVTRATNDVIWDYDIVHDALKWMNGYYETFGYKVDNNPVKAEWSMNRIHPDDRPRVWASFEQALVNKRTAWQSEYRYQCFDGTYKYVSDRGYILFDQDQNPLRMIGALQDIDTTKKYGDRLLLKNQKLKEIAWLNSHEIRRPLANLTALVQLIRPSLDDQENLIPILDHLETSVCELNEAVIKMNNQTKELEE